MIARRHFVAAALAVLAIGGIASSHEAQAQTLDAIKNRKVLRIAVSQDFPPFGSVGPDMTLQGFDIDLANLVAKAAGVTLELVPVSSVNRIPYLQTNKVDLVVSALGKTEERAKVIDFSLPYAPYFVGVFGPASVQVSTPADLAGKSLSVARGAVEDIELSKIAPPGLVVKRYEDANATTAAFLSGQTDLIATGNAGAAGILARNPPRKPELQTFLVMADRN